MGTKAPKQAKVYQNAPGSVAAASIDNATAESREAIRNKMQQARGRSYTNKTGGLMGQIGKALLGE